MRIAIGCLVFCLMFVLGNAASIAAGIDEHTVGIWTFDEGEGVEVKDLTDNHNDGEIQGDFDWVEGKFGTALEFSGAGSVIISNSESLDIAEQITIEAWVTVGDAGIGQDMVIAREEPAYSLQKFNDDRMEGWISLGGWQGVRDIGGGEPLEANEWYHVAFTYDGKTLKTYVNGEFERENAISGNIDVVDAPFTIGSDMGTSYYWIGEIDEVRVSNIARSEDDIKAIMVGFAQYLAVRAGEKLTGTWAQIRMRK